MAGRALLAGLAISIVLFPASGRPEPNRGVWFVLGGQYITLTVATAIVEGAWLLKAIASGSAAVSIATALYNPIYLLLAATSAAVPYLVLFLGDGARAGRRLALVLVMAVVTLLGLATADGAVRDWGGLMAWTQVLAFVEVGGYLTVWWLVLLGYARHISRHILGLLTVSGLFAVLMPIQAEFFELVGRGSAAQIWHLNQILQLVEVSLQIVIVRHVLVRARAMRLADAGGYNVGGRTGSASVEVD